MGHPSLWEQFLTLDNFRLAWQRTVNVNSRMVVDKLGLETFSYNLEANLEELVRQVEATDFPYEPQPDHKVYVPKASSTLRTMSLMSVADLVVYQALVNVVADNTHRFMVSHENQHVYGNVYAGAGSRWMLKRWRNQYRYFMQRIVKYYEAGNTWTACTDIVAFYDTIDHERLLGVIRSCCGEDGGFLNLLRKCLSKWSAHNGAQTMSRGIPQGSAASDFLANLFLYDIDRKVIVQGYNYARYVDDVRILGPDKATVQQGLILFDLELKRAGLVAQVSKTSVHEIVNIDKEIHQLQFDITIPTREGYLQPLSLSLQHPFTEQGGLVSAIADYVDDEGDNANEPSEEQQDGDLGGLEYTQLVDPHIAAIDEFQEHLLKLFKESFAQLDDAVRAKEAESTLVACLNRLAPNSEIIKLVIMLLSRLPWRSETVTRYLSQFKQEDCVAKALRDFIAEHKVYEWHRANCLEALAQVESPKQVSTICRAWLSDQSCNWYSRSVAARIMRDVPDQHAFLLECLRKEQMEVEKTPEDTAILRSELAHSAFQRIKSSEKQLTLLQLLCDDSSPVVRRLVIYLLQQPGCNVTWEDLQPYHERLSEFSELVQSLGISSKASKPCFIAQTLARNYDVALVAKDLRPIYRKHYDKAVKCLRESVAAYHHSPSQYVLEFHSFSHLTIIAFYESLLPGESGVYASEFNSLLERRCFKELLPRGIEPWKRLNDLRNRAAHPVERSTQTHSRVVTAREADDLVKALKVSLQELFDVWLVNGGVGSPSKV